MTPLQARREAGTSPDNARERTGLLLTGTPTVPEMVKLAQRAEHAGFDSVWVAETRLTRDAITPMAAIAQATERIRVGSGIINVDTRNPVVLAITFLSLEELAPGRVVLGLGAGSPRVLAPQGVAFDRPLTRLREYCEVVPALMRGEELSYSGYAVDLDRARIEDVLADGETADGRPDLPLYIGATGPRVLRYAGGAADGVLLNVCLGVDYLASRLRIIEEGAREHGRTLDDIEVAMAVVVSPHEDSRTGKDGGRRFIALYLAMFPNIASETGLSGDFIGEVRRTFQNQGVEEASKLVPDEVVDRLSASGTPAECRERLDAYRAAGLDLVVLTPVPGALERAIDALRPPLRT